MRICKSCHRPLNSELPEWRCEKCNWTAETRDRVVFFEPDVSGATESYNPAWYQELAGLEVDNFWFRVRNHLLLILARRYFPNSGKYLEIGCGTGFVLQMLQRQLTTWRILYMVPFSLVATIGIWSFVSKLKNQQIRTRVLTTTFLVIVSVVILDAFTVPKSPLIFRSLAIKPVGNSGLDISAWPELRNFLGSFESPVNIVTDPVTGYFIRGATKHTADGFKFHDYYDSVALNKVFFGNKVKHLMHPELKGRMLVINRADGPESLLGALSGHWPRSILKVSEAYPAEITDMITKHPDNFSHVWGSNNQEVYQLHPYSVDQILFDSFKN